MFIHRLDGEPLAVAGLWTTWRDKTAGPDAPWLHSCTVVTTSANATMAPVHDRMPVMLPATAWHEWLDPGNNNIEELQRLLVPAPDNLLTMHKVSTEVNNVRNKGAELIDADRLESSERGADGRGGRFHVVAVDRRRGVVERQLAHVVGRDHVDVGVRHLVAGDDHTDPLAVERLLLRSTDSMGDLEQVGDQFGRSRRSSGRSPRSARRAHDRVPAG